MNNYTEFLKAFGPYFTQIKDRFQATETFSTDLLKQLEENLLAANVSPQATQMVSEKLWHLAEGDFIHSGEDAYLALHNELVSLLETPLNVLSSRPQKLFEVKILIGWPDSGVTTTAVKLAYHLKKAGKNVFLISDALIYSTKTKNLRKQIRENTIDVQNPDQAVDSIDTMCNFLQSTLFTEPMSIIIDFPTHLIGGNTRSHELSKLHDMMSKKYPEASVENIGIFDAENGQQFVPQFRRMFSYDRLKSVILTKVDTSPKVGCAFALVDDIGAPITFLGIGADIEHLVLLDPGKFVDALFLL
ncbi:hypothetical protein [Tengunoibacter tsumagoiensis]|uniref:SRP54-type proteins GTP-binding domain-containing protein n=1 Tax=Tengunoibacter tsumagoiensis TaxID=2014871 RepID=A0A402A804_9CHLR|nr:hypothetical protein [Tengunoibacter tsumagoiensis]GCE15273.1 hypothetical protein KTT_51320 [Tengunoibacter tsumagoiensis]